MSGIDLIVGLGNPGAEHAGTRHNAGFQFLSALDGTLRYQSKYRAEVGEARIAGRRVWLLAPQTYMNLSGTAVAGFARFYKIDPLHILVAHDELDLPAGTVRLKSGGGAGGHNGLADIIAKLGAREFQRLRIGIGHPGDRSRVTAHVLRKAPVAEQELIDAAIAEAVRHIEDIVAGKYEHVMTRLHSKK